MDGRMILDFNYQFAEGGNGAGMVEWKDFAPGAITLIVSIETIPKPD